MINILVVEDNEKLRKLVKINLTHAGYKVFEAENGLEALDVLYSNSIHLMIVDIMMPEMDGYELTREIREANITTPILIVTAKETLEDKKKGFGLGADDYMVKPIDMEEMLRRLGRRLGVLTPPMEITPYLYVMSNTDGKYGAVSLLFSEELERFSDEIGNSFFILPSSIHELILIPDFGEVSAEYLSAMVYEVNHTQIEATEVLTDSIYYYDKEIHTVRRIA